MLRDRIMSDAQRQVAIIGGGNGEMPSRAAEAILARLDAALAIHYQLSAHDSSLDLTEYAAVSPALFQGREWQEEAVNQGAPMSNGFGFSGEGAYVHREGISPSLFLEGRSLHALSPLPQTFSWLPPPISSLDH